MAGRGIAPNTRRILQRNDGPKVELTDNTAVCRQNLSVIDPYFHHISCCTQQVMDRDSVIHPQWIQVIQIFHPL